MPDIMTPVASLNAQGRRHLKILVYGLNYAPELIGIGKYTQEMSEWLASRGHQVKVVTSYPHYPDWKVAKPYTGHRYCSERRNGVDLVRCPIYVPNKPSGSKRLLSHVSFALSSAPAVISAAFSFRPDVIFTVTPSLLTSPAGLIAARLSGARAWLHIQDFEIESAFELGILSGPRLRRFAGGMERRLLARFDRVSTISPKMVEGLRSKGIAPTRAIEFRNWVDTSIVKPQHRMTSFRRELGLGAEHVVALYSGSMAVKQGLDVIIDAARLLASQRPELIFILCGKGPTRNRLMEIAHELPNVRFLDLQPQDRIAELLATADIHLLPQRAEVADLVLPSKLGPILASGRPVIAMANPRTQLAAEVEGAGLIIPADDPAALIEAVVRLADDDSLRARLGASGRAAAEFRWNAQTVLERLEDHLIIALANTPGTTEPMAWKQDGAK